MQKKAYYTLLVFIVLIISYIICLFSITKNEVLVVNNTVSFKPTIVIDAGHGGEDGGACVGDILEKDVNLQISLKLRDFLASNGFSVIMTRSTDTALFDNNVTQNKKRNDLKNRVDIFNSNTNNIVISIHQNKFNESIYNGVQIFYSGNNKKSEALAQSIKNSVVSLIQPDNKRQCKQSGSQIYVLHNTQVPAILIECGFLSNEKEAQMLTNDSYQNKLAYTIYLGFLEFYNTNY